MTEHRKTIDISHIPDLMRLVDEVRRSDEPQVLRRGDEDLAVVIPLSHPTKAKSRRQPKTEADYEAFRSAAGGWADIDTDALIENIYESRRIPTRPRIDL